MGPAGRRGRARVAPLLLVLRDAARVDPEAGALADELDQSRLARMAENARYLAFAGHLRPGVTASDARDVLWLCSSPELFDLLVNRRGWSLDQFSHFVADTMTKRPALSRSPCGTLIPRQSTRQLEGVDRERRFFSVHGADPEPAYAAELKVALDTIVDDDADPRARSS